MVKNRRLKKMLQNVIPDAGVGKKTAVGGI